MVEPRPPSLKVHFLIIGHLEVVKGTDSQMILATNSLMRETRKLTKGIGKHASFLFLFLFFLCFSNSFPQNIFSWHFQKCVRKKIFEILTSSKMIKKRIF